MRILVRAHQQLVWDRTRLTNRLRNALREYFPGALQAFPSLAHGDAVGVLATAPGPREAARLTMSQIRAALRRGGRKRNVEGRAAELRAAFRTEQLAVPATVSGAFAATTRAAVAHIDAINRQIAELESDRKALEKRLLALAREADVARPPRVREPHHEHRELGQHVVDPGADPAEVDSRFLARWAASRTSACSRQLPLLRLFPVPGASARRATSRLVPQPVDRPQSPPALGLTFQPGLNALRPGRAAHSLALPGGLLRQAHGLAAVGQVEGPEIISRRYISQTDGHAPRELVARQSQPFQVGEVAQLGRDRPRQLVV